jgi:beta-galactosidase/beta-glucuronidase
MQRLNLFPASDVDGGSIPRPEYPRPDFVRSEWVNLNGVWEFEFDDGEVGFRHGWMDGRTLGNKILVPFPFQCELSGINDKGIHEVVWYARSFEVPEDWCHKDLLLHFGAVDYSATVWVNGEEVGSNRGGHVPFSFDVAPYVHTGTNRLTLRVEDRKDAYQPRGKQSSTGLPHGIDYYCTTGVWQTVWLEPVPPIRINEIRVVPVIEEKAFELRVFLHAPYLNWTIEAMVLDGDEVVAELSRDVGNAAARMFVRIPDAKLWSPERPHLYDLKVRLLKDGELMDEIHSYVGLRSVQLRNGMMYINGEPTYLKMVLDQGYWPQSYLAGPSDEAFRADVEWAKRFGFNGVRKHQKIEDPRWLYWCDRLGMLVWAEMPNARAWSQRTEELLVAEWTRALNRDINHPCIVAWVPNNESMGLPGLEQGHPGQYAFVERMVNATRRKDTERPIVDNDGWEHTDVGDILAIHDYTPDSKGLQERFKVTLDNGRLPEYTWLPNKPILATGSRYWGQPVMLTEVGGFLFHPPDVEREKLDMLYEFYGSITSFEQLLDKYRDLMVGISALQFVSGFCYTQLTDIEQEMNGLLTYDRQAKVPPEEIRRIHEELFPPEKGVQPLKEYGLGGVAESTEPDERGC